MLSRFSWGRAAGLASFCWLVALPVRATAADIFYAALFGEPEAVAAGTLAAAPGLYVGRAVRTQARVTRWDGDATAFDIDLGGQRAVLRLEPETQARLSSRPSTWEGRAIEVEGLFYREAREAGPSPYALRAWSVRAMGVAPAAEAARPGDAPLLTLEELVYGGGRYDGRLIRVHGTYRGANSTHDLPEATRKGKRDWVIKDGYFAAWIAGREARGETWDLTSSPGSTTVLEIVGVPVTSKGVVRIIARAVGMAPVEETAAVRAVAAPQARGETVPLHVSFAYPVPGEALGPRGAMILQFNKSMDAHSFEGRVRVRYERAGATVSMPGVTHVYRDRYRALVVTPDPPPPPGAEVVVELLEGVIDVDGNGVVAEARFGGRR